MSVDYNAILVRGWRIDGDDFDNMNAASDWEFESDFHIASAYDDHPEWVFGDYIKRIACEGIIEVIDTEDIKALTEVSDAQYEEWQRKLVKCGRPDLAALRPQLYFIGQIC